MIISDQRIDPAQPCCDHSSACLKSKCTTLKKRDGVMNQVVYRFCIYLNKSGEKAHDLCLVLLQFSALEILMIKIWLCDQDFLLSRLSSQLARLQSAPTLLVQNDQGVETARQDSKRNMGGKSQGQQDSCLPVFELVKSSLQPRGQKSTYQKKLQAYKNSAQQSGKSQNCTHSELNYHG